MNRENIFLTETRRAVLDGESDLSGRSLENEKSRIRTRARAALDELIEVAQSNEIENRSVFEPETLGDLTYWILNDPSQFDQMGGIVAQEGEEIDADEEAVARYTDELASYRRDVYAEVDGPLRSVRHPERGRFDEP